MKMEVISVQSSYGALGSNKVRDWTSTLTPPLTSAAAAAATTAASAQAATAKVMAAGKTRSANAGGVATKIINNKSSINKNNNNSYSYNYNYNYNYNYIKKQQQEKANNRMKPSYYHHQHHTANSQQTQTLSSAAAAAAAAAASSLNSSSNAYNFYCDQYDIDAAAVDELSLRLLDELRAAKSRHLTCTEVSLPCDLTPSIAAEIIRVSEKEPCGIRGCTIYIEFEDEPRNSRRIASLKLDPETVSTFEVYLTLRQDHRGWTALLPQFMKSLARTITISPEFTITKHKLYTAEEGLNNRRSYSFSSSRSIATPST